MNEKLICIDKLYSCVLFDNNNSMGCLSPNKLKTSIKNNIVAVSNLKLTYNKIR